MKKLMLFFVLSLMYGCTASKPMMVIYSGIKYLFPANPSALVAGSDNSVIVTYKTKAASNYISIFIEEEFDTGTCSNTEFFKVSLISTSQEECDTYSLSSFKHVFAKNSDIGVWDEKYFYFLRKEKSHVFKVTDDEIIMFTSNFLSKDEWKKVFALF